MRGSPSCRRGGGPKRCRTSSACRSSRERRRTLPSPGSGASRGLGARPTGVGRSGDRDRRSHGARVEAARHPRPDRADPTACPHEETAQHLRVSGSGDGSRPSRGHVGPTARRPGAGSARHRAWHRHRARPPWRRGNGDHHRPRQTTSFKALAGAVLTWFPLSSGPAFTGDCDCGYHASHREHHDAHIDINESPPSTASATATTCARSWPTRPTP
jgi:hypothetical protein